MYEKRRVKKLSVSSLFLQCYSFAKLCKSLKIEEGFSEVQTSNKHAEESQKIADLKQQMQHMHHRIVGCGLNCL